MAAESDSSGLRFRLQYRNDEETERMFIAHSESASHPMSWRDIIGKPMISNEKPIFCKNCPKSV